MRTSDSKCFCKTDLCNGTSQSEASGLNPLYLCNIWPDVLCALAIRDIRDILRVSEKGLKTSPSHLSSCQLC